MYSSSILGGAIVLGLILSTGSFAEQAPADLAGENLQLKQRVAALEAKLAKLSDEVAQLKLSAMTQPAALIEFSLAPLRWADEKGVNLVELQAPFVVHLLEPDFDSRQYIAPKFDRYASYDPRGLQPADFIDNYELSTSTQPASAPINPTAP